MANTNLSLKLDNGGELNGFYDPKFEGVAHEFVRNFQERAEVGASVAVTVEGDTVVDLWGGVAKPSDSTPWEKDTVSIVWSCTKGATAICAHNLAARGLLDYDALVAKYWPEYAQNGKENTRVSMLLAHQSGLPAFKAPLPDNAFCDWDFICNALAEQAPFWEPGTAHGYQMVSFGWLVGELVRRVSGKSLGQFFQDEVAKPLGLDFWIGLPESEEHRVAPMIPAPPPSMDGPFVPFYAEFADPTSVSFLSIMNMGGHMNPGTDGVFNFDSRAAHAAEIGGAGGITNARGLAGMYAPLANGGSLKGVTLVDADTLARAAAVHSATALDRTLRIPMRYGLGFWKSIDNRNLAPGQQDSAIISEEAFGHPGAGGSVGFADPKARMSFGYTMNSMGAGLVLNERGQSLVDATYRTLGYTSNKSGRWI